MVRQQSGKLINVASMWGLAGASSVAPIPAYNAAKGAVVNLTRELALEYATQNIQCWRRPKTDPLVKVLPTEI